MLAKVAQLAPGKFHVNGADDRNRLALRDGDIDVEKRLEVAVESR